MKKRIAAILLVVIMLLPALASCKSEAPLPENEVTVYTLHMIKEDSTTDEAIQRVSLALNRILFYRLGSCLEIIAYTEDEYYDAIEAKFAEMEEYELKVEEEKKNNKKDKDKKNDDEESAEVSVDVFTGEDYLTLLENGEEFVREEPRFDIFLINSYDKYYEYASTGKLSAVNDQLTSECKILKDYIHPTLLSAAAVNGKPYGVPLNNIIGEYSYIVYDKELLDKYQIDYQTMASMDDLQSYLATIAENETDVVPLANSADPTSLDFIFSSLSPAYVKNKFVYSTYESDEIASYYSYIQMLYSMGYLKEAGEDDRVAVQFVSGNEETIANMEKEDGREYEYVVYKNPVATNENCINGIFAFSSYCKSNELTAAMELITAIYTNKELANIFAYGIEDIHYELSDNDQVIRKNDEYMINSLYAGNSFITYTLDGEDIDKWEKAKLQNLNATVAVDIGFKLQPTEFEWTLIEEVEENGKIVEKETEIIVASPDYIEIINNITAKYYPAIIGGYAIDLDLATLRENAELGIEDTIRTNLQNTYATRLQNDYSNSVSAKYDLSTTEGTKLYNKALEQVNNTIYDTVYNELETKHRAEIITELTPMYDDEDALMKAVEERLTKLLTENFVNEAIERDYGAEYIEELAMSQYNREVQNNVSTALKAYIGTAEYTDAYNAAIASDEFAAELEAELASDLSATIDDTVNSLVSEMVKEHFQQIMDECSEALTIAIDEFVAEVIEMSNEYDDEPMMQEEVLFELGLMEKVSEADENGEVISETYEPIEMTSYEYVIDIITDQYYKMFGDPTTPNG